MPPHLPNLQLSNYDLEKVVNMDLMCPIIVKKIEKKKKKKKCHITYLLVLLKVKDNVARKCLESSTLQAY